MTRSLAPGGLEQNLVRLFGVLLCLAVVVPVLPRLGVLAGAVALLLAAGTAWLVWRWVPGSISGALQRRPVVAVLWALGALLALVQVGRLSAFMAEPDRSWGSVVPDPRVAGHACLSAYIVAADLSRRGLSNLYDERFYPAFGGDASKLLAPGDIRDLRTWMEDPYEYPPPFLLLPRLALLLSSDFLSIRAAWFVLQALGLVVVGAWLARWIGGRDGQLAFLLLPVLLASLPTLLGLQFGQFQERLCHARRRRQREGIEHTLRRCPQPPAGQLYDRLQPFDAPAHDLQELPAIDRQQTALRDGGRVCGARAVV